ncbi:hypothetical protein ACO0LV_15090 [Pseudactinotalea sp. Z1739]|uniref:hypothetical protein n=1 Tax=Pseudactinotalea sp. Z1739 TaxID=3413028 RepID=UPI003C79EF07
MSTQILPPPGEFKTTEEIRDARFAETLRRRRRLLLWWSAPVVLLAFLVAVKFLSAVVINTAGISAYDNENHNTAATRFGHLEFFNVVEPWKPYFNAGTAVYSAGDFFGATVPLGMALDLVPKAPEEEPRGELECAVRTNYSLSLEGLGDEALLAEDPGTALDYYEQAQEMLADCVDGGGGGEEAEEADERQQESQDQAEEQQEQQQQDQQDSGQGEQEQETPEGGEDEDPTETDDGENGDPTETETDNGDNGDPTETETEEPGDPREEELEERNRQAQRDREEQEQQESGGDGSGQNW